MLGIMTITASKQDDMSIQVETSNYPKLDVGNISRHGNSEENKLMEGSDLKKLDELKQLSKKIEKDLEEIKKQGKQIEQKIKQRETPPKFCFFFSLKTGAIVLGFFMLVFFSISFFGMGLELENQKSLLDSEDRDKSDSSSYNSGGITHIRSYRSQEMKRRMSIRITRLSVHILPSIALALISANMLLFAIFMNHKGCLFNYLVLSIFILNWFIVNYFKELVNIAGNNSFLVYYGLVSVFQAFALYNVYNYYKTLD